MQAVGVIDRDYGFGSTFHSGVLANEMRAALYPLASRPKVLSFVAGLGGREVNIDNVITVASKVSDAAEGGASNDRETYWIGVRE